MRHKRIALIANNGPNLDQALASHCEKFNLEILVAESGLSAILMAQKHSPDIMIIDDTVPMAEGLKICEKLNELQIAIPVIILAQNLDAEMVQSYEALNAHPLLKDDDIWGNLEPLISEQLLPSTQVVIGEKNRQASSNNRKPLRTSPLVLAVDDDPDVTRAMKIRLAFHGIETIEACNSRAAFMIALRDKPDVIITDYRMPQGSGDYLAVRLKEAKETESIPIIILTGQTFDGSKDHSLERDLLGRCKASAFLMKPLDFDKLIAELEKYIVVKPVKTIAA